MRSRKFATRRCAGGGGDAPALRESPSSRRSRAPLPMAVVPFAVGLSVFRPLPTWGEVASTNSLRIERIDGTALQGNWLGSPDGRSLRFLHDGAAQTEALEVLSLVEFSSEESTAAGSVTIFLADGGELRGDILEGAEEGVVAKLSISNRVRLRFDRLAGVRFADPSDFPRAAELFESVLRHRLPGQDVLITREVEEVKTVRGRLSELDSVRGSFAFADSTRTFSVERLFGIVFAAGSAPREALPILCRLSDGSSFSADLIRTDPSLIRFRTSFDIDVDIPLARMRALEFLSDRVVYLNDRTPVNQTLEGRLHRPWPARMNRNVANSPLSMSGRTIRRGIGVHARTELIYELDAAYESFAATIGIDDAVRPRGSVAFRVFGFDPSPRSNEAGESRGVIPAALIPSGTAESKPPAPQGDRRLLFDSGQITGRDPPRDILVDIRGVARLILSVDFADLLDLSDYADWGSARLIKPAKRPRSSTP